MSARILVVDDVSANIKPLEARLSAEYFDVLTVSNGAEALKICQRAECDIALLEVMMPDMDGFEVCRRLKADPATHFIPLLMIARPPGRPYARPATTCCANSRGTWRKSIRGIDLACRYGGEGFVIVMPETDLHWRA